MNEYTRFDAGELHGLARSILMGCGMKQEDADVGAGVLLYADLRGIDSHGVAHLSAHQSYVRGMRNGNVNPRPDVKIVSDRGALALVDGDGGLGPVVGHRAMGIAIKKARVSGVGLVGVSNSRHYGSAGYYAEMALEHDMIGISMTQASPAVLPTHGAKRKLGTNAISFAIPAGGRTAFRSGYGHKRGSRGEAGTGSEEVGADPGWVGGGLGGKGHDGPQRLLGRGRIGPTRFFA